MSKVIIIGAGAAGMFCSIAAAMRGHEVTIYEKNDKPGKKLFITGKGRCNLTNQCDMETLMEQVVSNRKFLFSSFYGFTNEDAIRFFENLGLKTKTERGGRVFPVSDKSSDVIKVLTAEMKRLGVRVCYDTAVLGLEIKTAAEDGGRRSFAGVRLSGSRQVQSADCLVIATGGCSYPLTGSTGDGFRFAEELGHKVTELYPSLVPFEVKEDWAKELMGLSLKNITLEVRDGKKSLFKEFGELLFTHFGVSGPLVLSASALLTERLRKKNLELYIDLKPALSVQELDERLQRDFAQVKNKQFKNALDLLLPKRMTSVIIALSGISPEKKINEITREERAALCVLFKQLPLTVTGVRGYGEAVVTKGGVSIKEINSQTMESKLVSGVYFIGEVLDLDAMTGGFNLQIAWSTAFAAGSNIPG